MCANWRNGDSFHSSHGQSMRSGLSPRASISWAVAAPMRRSAAARLSRPRRSRRILFRSIESFPQSNPFRSVESFFGNRSFSDPLMCISDPLMCIVPGHKSSIDLLRRYSQIAIFTGFSACGPCCSKRTVRLSLESRLHVLIGIQRDALRAGAPAESKRTSRSGGRDRDTGRLIEIARGDDSYLCRIH